MEEQKEPEIQQKPSLNPQYVLAGAILLAALVVSGTLVYVHVSPTGNNVAQIGAGNNGNAAGQQAAAPVANIKLNAGDHILGNKNAKVNVVEYADFRCPFCERFFKQVEDSIIKNYVNTGKANFVFRSYALLGQQSTWASEASECASEQGKFWPYHDWLYNNQALESDLNYYSKENLIKYAGNIGGLNSSQFASCLNSDKYAKTVADSLSGGQQAGVTGTPTIFVNGKIIVGAQPYETFQAAIDNALK